MAFASPQVFTVTEAFGLSLGALILPHGVKPLFLTMTLSSLGFPMCFRQWPLSTETRPVSQDTGNQAVPGIHPLMPLKSVPCESALRMTQFGSQLEMQPWPSSEQQLLCADAMKMLARRFHLSDDGLLLITAHSSAPADWHQLSQ